MGGGGVCGAGGAAAKRGERGLRVDGSTCCVFTGSGWLYVLCVHRERRLVDPVLRMSVLRVLRVMRVMRDACCVCLV